MPHFVAAKQVCGRGREKLPPQFPSTARCALRHRVMGVFSTISPPPHVAPAQPAEIGQSWHAMLTVAGDLIMAVPCVAGDLQGPDVDDSMIS